MSEPATPDPSDTGESRLERKERTRQAILAAALRLTCDGSLVALSLRQVTKEVGIVPTAFYRHFGSIEELGLTLVDESFASLRQLLREVRRRDPEVEDIIDGSLGVLLAQVHEHEEHFRFIARERAAGPPAVREAIRHGLDLFERELAADLTRLPGTAVWSAEDLRVLSRLIVTAMVAAVEGILDAGRPAREREVVESARTQLRMVLVGALNWRSSSPDA